MEEITEAHPLQNPVVLQRLFELIPFQLKDFRNFRLVSRAWHTLSLSLWRQNAQLILLDKNPEEGGLGNASRISRQKYLELLENEQHQLVQHPFRKYFLGSWKINLRSDQVRFWNRVGPLMTHLTLQTCDFAGVADLRTVIFKSTPNLHSLSLLRNEYTSARLATRAQRLNSKLPQHALIPSDQVRNNLVEFSIDLVAGAASEYYSDSDDEESFADLEYFPITWMELFIHFPNIKKLERLELGRQTGRAELLEFFKSLEILRKEHGPRYLANIDGLELLQPSFDGKVISSISRLRFPLKKLEFRMRPEADVDEKAFRQLFQSPLEHLNINRKSFREGREGRPFRNFPFGHQFLTLKELTMRGPIAPNLMFLKACPNLETFTYTPFNEDLLDAHLAQVLGDGNRTKLEKLKKLFIRESVCSAEEIKKLRMLMPNVMTLCTGLDDESFKAVCDVWKELERLGIHPFRVGEDALLGKDKQTGEKFRHPNITDLKKLKSFTMEDCQWKRDRQGLTEAVIVDGILALPNIEWASLCILPEVTLRVRNQLKKKFPHRYCESSVQKGVPKTHPLQNPKVLERLFELVPFELQDFKNFRLVSRAWKVFSLETWRQNAWLALRESQPEPETVEDDDDSDYEDVNSDDEGIPGICRQKYLELLGNEQYQLIQQPFRKYFLEGWTINLNSTNPDQVRFWNRAGPLMTHLTMEKSSFAGVADLRAVIFKETPNLQSLSLIENVYTSRRISRRAQRLDPKLLQHALIPAEQVRNNLTEFNISLIDIQDDTDEEDEFGDVVPGYFPITWMEFLIHFPNIKKLGQLTLGKEGELREFFRSVKILRKEHGPHYLANLIDLNLCQMRGRSDFSWRLFSSIIVLRFPLKRLEFVVNPSVDEKTFKKLLQHPLEFLKVVQQAYVDVVGRPSSNFPLGVKFLALKKLFLSGPIASNLKFLKDCPNLEELLYEPFKKDGMDADLTQGLRDVNFPKLEKLKALWITNNLSSAEQIRKLRELMPNVKHLKIGLDDSAFRALCESWKGLERLTIDPWRIGEAALLGKDEHSGKKFRHPNITDLKYMKVFNVQLQGNRRGFTDAMILDGVLALPNLEHVLGISLSSQVSGHARSLLEKKFPECEICTQEEEPAGGRKEFVVAEAKFQRNFQNN